MLRTADNPTPNVSKLYRIKRYNYFQMKRVLLVDVLGSEPKMPGTFHQTTSHAVFRADEGVKEIWIANALISSVEKLPTTANNGVQLLIKCKHFQTLTLQVAKDKDCTDIIESLVTSSRLCKY
jgi:hypothetical protein